MFAALFFLEMMSQKLDRSVYSINKNRSMFSETRHHHDQYSPSGSTPRSLLPTFQTTTTITTTTTSCRQFATPAHPAELTRRLM